VRPREVTSPDSASNESTPSTKAQCGTARNEQVRGSSPLPGSANGRTWNRTSALTESESFEQQGGGATAAVIGSAFAVFKVDLPTPHFEFLSLVDGLRLTAENGEVKLLNAGEECDYDTKLYDVAQQLTADVIAANAFLVANFFLDGIAGLPGFVGTVTVESAHVYAEPNGSFTMTATAQDGTTSGPQVVVGNAAAKYFGFYTTDTANPLVSIDVSCDDSSAGFAIGEFGIDQAPSSTASDASATSDAPLRRTPLRRTRRRRTRPRRRRRRRTRRHRPRS
jgi:hypothetical protein